MTDAPELGHAASASTLSGQSALVSSHPDSRRGNARKYIVFLHALMSDSVLIENTDVLP